MTQKHYTQDWSHQFIMNTKGLGKFDLAMEIGCFEGRTSNYIVDNLLTENGKLICIDPLADGNTPTIPMQPVFKNQYERFIHNTQDHREAGKLTIIHGTSQQALGNGVTISKFFIGECLDFIYIDGDHDPEMVYIDAVNSFRYAKIGGIILFDDYNWNDVHNAGIDKFLEEYAGRYELMIKDYQVMIKKIQP